MKAVTSKLIDTLYSESPVRFDVVPDTSKIIEVPGDVLYEERRNFKNRK